MEFIQRIKQFSVGICSVLGIVAMLGIIAFAESLPEEAYMILAVGLVVVIVASVIYQAYINLHQFYVRKKKVINFADELEQSDDSELIVEYMCEQESKRSVLEDKIFFFIINAFARSFGKKVEWNQNTNEMVIRDMEG